MTWDDIRQLQFKYKSPDVERSDLKDQLINKILEAENSGHFDYAINIATNLLTLLKISYLQNERQVSEEEHFMLDQIQQLAQRQVEQKEERPLIKKVVINFCGTGCPPFIKGSAHDDILIDHLLADPSHAALNIRGVGISKNGKVNLTDIGSGAGMAERINEAADYLIDIKDRLAPDAEIVILGHSRGAVEALAFAKVLNAMDLDIDNDNLNKRKCLIVAHDPVVGGKEKRPRCLKEKVKVGNESISVGDLLNRDEVIPADLQVVVRSNERRKDHFKLLSIPNAYKAMTMKVDSMAGYHSLGAFDTVSANLDAEILFRKVRWFLHVRSKGSNQWGSNKMDPYRREMKVALFNDYMRLVKSFLGGRKVEADEKQDVEEKEHSVENGNQPIFSTGAIGNPGYHLFCASDSIREIPDFLHARGASYPLEKLLTSIDSKDRYIFQIALGHQIKGRSVEFNACIETLSLEKLIKFYELIDEGLKSPRLGDQGENDPLVKQLRELTIKHHLFHKDAPSRTRRWQRALHDIKQRMIEKNEVEPTDDLTQENIRALLSSHNGRLYTFFRKTKSIRLLEKKEQKRNEIRH